MWEEENKVLPRMAEKLANERMDSLGGQLIGAKHERDGKGKDTDTGLDDLSKRELYEMAQAANVNGRSNMTKNQLREALRS
jgi:hypothetical protein